MSTLRVTTLQNTSGVEVYTCKAWVNFNGTGTVAIRASGNVTSITDNGAGDYTVNLTNAMPDGSYSLAGLAATPGTASGLVFPATSLPAAGSFRFATVNNAFTYTDHTYVSMTVYR